MSGTSITPSSGTQQPRNRQMMRRGDDIDPFLVLRREMDRVFDDLFRGIGMPSVPPPPFGRVAAPMLAPHIDVSETDQEVKIAAELPGIDEQDVEISLSDNTLTIRGEKRVEQEEKDRNYRIVERARGSFSRTLRLPFRVDPGKVGDGEGRRSDHHHSKAAGGSRKDLADRGDAAGQQWRQHHVRHCWLGSEHSVEH